MNLLKQRYAALSALFLGLCIAAHAEVPTEITEITTNAGTVWASVKGIIVGVVGFLVLIAFVKRVRKG